MKKIFLFMFFGPLVAGNISAEKRRFIHPGITYTQADLDRMKAMVQAKQEPFYTTYKALLESRYSKVEYKDYKEITEIPNEHAFNRTIGMDGRCAHDQALLYHITGDTAYANNAVRRLNRDRKSVV